MGKIKARNIRSGAMKFGGKKDRQKMIGKVPMPLQYVRRGIFFCREQPYKNTSGNLNEILRS